MMLGATSLLIAFLSKPDNNCHATEKLGDWLSWFTGGCADSNT